MSNPGKSKVVPDSGISFCVRYWGYACMLERILGIRIGEALIAMEISILYRPKTQVGIKLAL